MGRYSVSSLASPFTWLKIMSDFFQARGTLKVLWYFENSLARFLVKRMSEGKGGGRETEGEVKKMKENANT